MRLFTLIFSTLSWLTVLPTAAVGQISVELHDDLQSLVQNLFVAGGVKVYNVRFRGDNEGNIRAIGSFQRGPGGPNLIFSRGLILSTGDVKSAIGPNQVPNSTFIEADASHSYREAGLGGDPDLQRLVVPPTYDAAVLEFEFEAQSDSVFFRYIFASEEYTEWVDEPYNDVFAFFISGPGIVGMQNLALLPDGQAVSVNSVNHLRNTAYYIDNAYYSPWQPAPHNIRYDGFIRALVAKAKVIPCRRYRLKIAIADVEDQIIDSAVLLEAFSLSSNVDTVQVVGGRVPGTNQPTTWESCERDLKLVYRRRNTAEELRIPIMLGGTARNLIDYRLSAYEFHFPAGVDSSVIYVHALWDELAEGTESVILTYRPINSCEDHTVRFFIQDANPRLIVEPVRSLTRCGLPGDTTLNLRARVELPGGNFNIEWRDRWGNRVSNQPNWTFRPTSDTLLVVHARDRFCSIPIQPDTFRYRLLYYDRQNPLTFHLPDTLVCRNTSVTYNPQPRNGSGNYTYEWSNGSRASSLTEFITQPTRISLRVRDECQSTARTAQIDVHRGSVILPDSFLVCKGRSIDISPALNTTAGWASFKWTDLRSDSTLSTQSRLPNWLADRAYDLRFEAIDACREVFSARTRIRLFPYPKLNLADTVGICEGEPFSIDAQLVGVGVRNLRWTRLRDGQVVSRTARLNGLAIQDEVFRLDFSDTCGIEVSQVVFLKVSPRNLLVSSIQVEPDTVVCKGTQIQFNISASQGSGYYSYLWSDGSTSPQRSVVVTGPQTYSVTVSDGCSTVIRSRSVNVFPEPVLNISQSDTTICRGSELRLVASASGGSGAWGQLSWRSNDNAHLGTGEQIVLRFERNAQVWAEVQDGCNRVARDSLRVTLYPELELDPVAGRTVCYGDSALLQAKARGTEPLAFRWIQLPDSAVIGNNSTLKLVPESDGRFLLQVRDLCSKKETRFSIKVIKPTLRLEKLEFIPNQTVCKGSEVQVIAHLRGGSGAFVYDWSTHSRDSSTRLLVQEPQIIRLLASDGCQVIDTLVQVRVYPLPRVITPDSITLCAGEPVILQGQASGGNGRWNRIEWTDPQNYLLGSEFRLRIVPQVEGLYRLLVEDGCRFQAIDSVYVSLMPAAEIKLPTDTTICLGQSIQIPSQVLGASSSTRYSWSPPTGLNDPTRPDPIAQPTSTTRYQLRAWTNGCPSRAAEIEVRVLEPPRINLFPQYLLCKGKDSILVQPRSVSGALPLRFDWNPKPIFSIPNAERSYVYADHSQVINLKVIDRNGCVNQASSFLHVVETPEIIPLPDTFFCRGEAGVLLLQQTRNGGQIRWTWIPTLGIHQLDGKRLWFRPDSTQIYRYIATSAESGCSSDTVSFKVSVYERPIVKALHNQTICLGDSVTLVARPESAHSSGWRFHWIAGDAVISSKQSTLIAKPPHSMSFFVWATDSLCQGPIDSVRIQVLPTPTVSIPPLIEACQGDSIEIQATVAGSPTYRFQWSPSHLFNPSTQQKAWLRLDSTQTIWLEVWGAHCNNPVIDSTFILIRKRTQVEAGQGTPPYSRQIFRGDTLRLAGRSAADVGAIYRWEPAYLLDNPSTLTPWAKPDSTITFTLTVIDGPCVASDSIRIEVVERVKVEFLPLRTLLCAGDTLRLSVRRNRSELRLEWQPEPLVLIKDTLAIYTPLHNTQYRVIARDQQTLESDTAHIEIEVWPPPLAAFDWGLAEPCSSTLVSFENRSFDSAFSIWDFGDGSPISNDTHPYHEYQATGQYLVRLWVQSGPNCSDSVAQWIQVRRFSTPSVSWKAYNESDSLVYLPQATVGFELNIERAADWWLEWGDGSISREKQSRHQYRQSGFFTPVLVVIDSIGCRQVIPLPTVEVREPTLHIPNAFSPNGDGLNDQWQLYYRGGEPCRILIYSRNGQVLFESDSAESKWDGTFNGQPIPEGTYLIEVRLGEKKYYQFLTLIR